MSPFRGEGCRNSHDYSKRLKLFTHDVAERERGDLLYFSSVAAAHVSRTALIDAVYSMINQRSRLLIEILLREAINLINKLISIDGKGQSRTDSNRRGQ